MNIRNAKFYKVVFFLLLFLVFQNVSFSAVDVRNSYDTNVKIFGNCKVSLVNLKDGKKFVFLEIQISPKQFFRIAFDKHKPMAFMDLVSNTSGYRSKATESGYTNVIIGDRQYNVEFNLSIEGNYYVCFYRMPDDFLKLLSKNDRFFIDESHNNTVYAEILLGGFDNALDYVKQLQKNYNIFSTK